MCALVIYIWVPGLNQLCTIAVGAPGPGLQCDANLAREPDVVLMIWTTCGYLRPIAKIEDRQKVPDRG